MKSRIALFFALTCMLAVVVTLTPTAHAEIASATGTMTLHANAEVDADCDTDDASRDWSFGKKGNGDDDDDDDAMYCVCHMPPGNPGNSTTTCGSAGKICAHLKHGDAMGECPATCGGAEGAPCEDGQFCKVPDGECADDAEGMCMEIPGMCPSIFAPVCGCDGTTYSNACFADAAGAAVESEGACSEPVACGGDAGDTCGMDQYCKTADGECADDAEGTCEDLPLACPDIYAPVCGCDEMTYDNACLAAAAGANVASEGECDEDLSCGGDTGNMCEDDEFCKAPEGECAEDAEGECTAKPEMCPAIFAPVCGCDGNTYDNECVADGAGTSVASQGACDDGGGDVECGGTAGDTCEDGQFCKGETGACGDDAPGICTDIPMGSCSGDVAPVCGCDGMTYDNECLADAASVTVKLDGECPRALGRRR